MAKIVIISSTNRPGSNTLKVSRIYESILQSLNVNCEILDFCDLPQDIAFSELFGKRSEKHAKTINDFIVPNKHFIFVAPEYNGSFPGILKTFLDTIHPKEWTNKHACLVGVSNGRAGNLRGMDHLTGVLNYLKMHVYHNKLPISVVDKLLAADGTFISEEQFNVCKAQVEGFLKCIND